MLLNFITPIANTININQREIIRKAWEHANRATKTRHSIIDN